MKCIFIIHLNSSHYWLPIKKEINNNKHVVRQLHSMQLQKEVNLIQNSPAIKKSV